MKSYDDVKSCMNEMQRISENVIDNPPISEVFFQELVDIVKQFQEIYRENKDIEFEFPTKIRKSFRISMKTIDGYLVIFTNIRPREQGDSGYHYFWQAVTLQCASKNDRSGTGLVSAHGPLEDLDKLVETISIAIILWENNLIEPMAALEIQRAKLILDSEDGTGGRTE